MAYMERKAMPSANHIITGRLRDDAYAAHVRALSRTKPVVDTRPPRTFPHLQKRGKKLALAEERYTQIERENLLLLRKMHHILSHTNPELSIHEPAGPRSMNIGARRTEVSRIMEENLAILSRIQHVRTEFDHRKMDEEARLQEEHLRLSSAFASKRRGSPTHEFIPIGVDPDAYRRRLMESRSIIRSGTRPATVAGGGMYASPGEFDGPGEGDAIGFDFSGIIPSDSMADAGDRVLPALRGAASGAGVATGARDPMISSASMTREEARRIAAGGGGGGGGREGSTSPRAARHGARPTSAPIRRGRSAGRAPGVAAHASVDTGRVGLTPAGRSGGGGGATRSGGLLPPVSSHLRHHGPIAEVDDSETAAPAPVTGTVGTASAARRPPSARPGSAAATRMHAGAGVHAGAATVHTNGDGDNAAGVPSEHAATPPAPANADSGAAAATEAYISPYLQPPPAPPAVGLAIRPGSAGFKRTQTAGSSAAAAAAASSQATGAGAGAAAGDVQRTMSARSADGTAAPATDSKAERPHSIRSGRHPLAPGGARLGPAPPAKESGTLSARTGGGAAHTEKAATSDAPAAAASAQTTGQPPAHAPSAAASHAAAPPAGGAGAAASAASGETAPGGEMAAARVGAADAAAATQGYTDEELGIQNDDTNYDGDGFEEEEAPAAAAPASVTAAPTSISDADVAVASSRSGPSSAGLRVASASSSSAHSPSGAGGISLDALEDHHIAALPRPRSANNAAWQPSIVVADASGSTPPSSDLHGVGAVGSTGGVFTATGGQSTRPASGRMRPESARRTRRPESAGQTGPHGRSGNPSLGQHDVDALLGEAGGMATAPVPPAVTGPAAAPALSPAFEIASVESDSALLGEDASPMSAKAEGGAGVPSSEPASSEEASPDAAVPSANAVDHATPAPAAAVAAAGINVDAAATRIQAAARGRQARVQTSNMRTASVTAAPLPAIHVTSPPHVEASAESTPAATPPPAQALPAAVEAAESSVPVDPSAAAFTAAPPAATGLSPDTAAVKIQAVARGRQARSRSGAGEQHQHRGSTSSPKRP